MQNVTNSVNILVFGLDELNTTIKRLFNLGGILAWGRDQYTRGRSLCFAGLTDLSPALHVNVGDVLVFAKNGEVAKHINWGDVCGDDNESETKSKGRLTLR